MTSVITRSACPRSITSPSIMHAARCWIRRRNKVANTSNESPAKRWRSSSITEIRGMAGG
jgi:hypothetical protein